MVKLVGEPPVTKPVVLALVIAGNEEMTSVYCWKAVPAALVALSLSRYVPSSGGAGDPEMPVTPLRLLSTTRSAGREVAPLGPLTDWIDSVGVGKPELVKLTLPLVPPV